MNRDSFARVLIILLTTTLTLGLYAGCSRKDAPKSPPEEFSADVTANGGGVSFSGKAYVKKDKLRLEMPESHMITRLDKGKVWVLFPSQKIYMEQIIDKAEHNLVGVGKIPGEIERKMVAKETIDGKKVHKYRITRKEGEGEEETIYQWIDPDNGIPIRTADPNGEWSFEYKNARVGSQPDDLFELPQDYTKFAMPNLQGQVPGFMPGEEKGDVTDVD